MDITAGGPAAEGGLPVADVPSVQQAATALKALAKQAIKLPPAERASQFARHRVVLGLVECLRVTPPRGPPSGAFQSPGLPPPAAAGSVRQQLQQPRQAEERQRLTAAELSGALWSLAVLGGDVHYQAEMEALVAQLPGTQFDRLLQEAARLANGVLGKQQASNATLHGAATSNTSRQGRANGCGGGNGSMTCQQIASIVWGLSVLGWSPRHLLELVPEMVQHWEQQSSSQQVTPGDASCSSSPLRDAGKLSLRQAMPALPSLCTLAWAMAVSGQAPVAAWRAVLAALARLAYMQQQRQRGSAQGLSIPGKGPEGKAGAAPKKQLMQLHQVALALGAGGPAGGKAAWLEGLLAGEKGLHPEAVDALAQLFKDAATAAAGLAQERGHLKSSGCQNDVANTLGSLGLSPSEEYQVVAGVTVDAAVPRLLLAVEVDGPTHFTRNPAPPLCPQQHGCEGNASSGPAAAQSRNTVLGGRPVGATLLKHRLLEQHGWRVVHVDTEAWERLRGPERKRASLEAALHAAGVKTC
ncbi:hypothetical protein N2152v2_004358 [Parachlorella kessleri]